MEDYEYLIGAAPTSAEKQKQVAEALRRRRAFGDLAAMTGDKVLGPFGEQTSERADKYARQLQLTRLADTDNAQTAKYQGKQMEQMDKTHALNQAMLAETKRNNDQNFAYHMASVKQRNMEAFMESMSKGTDFKKFTDSTRNKMLSQADTAASMKTLADTFNDEFSQRLGPGPLSLLPNTLSQLGVGTQGSKEAGQWWSEWKKFYTLGTRNLLFGATLTTNEQKAWEEVDINPSMSPKQIRERMDKLFGQVGSSIERRGKTMSTEGFDPDVITEMYGDVFPEMKFGPQGQQGRGMSRTTKSVTSSDVSTMSEEEIQDMLNSLMQGGTQ